VNQPDGPTVVGEEKDEIIDLVMICLDGRYKGWHMSVPWSTLKNKPDVRQIHMPALAPVLSTDRIIQYEKDDGMQNEMYWVVELRVTGRVRFYVLSTNEKITAVEAIGILLDGFNPTTAAR
jgi:hypothetical protein